MDGAEPRRCGALGQPDESVRFRVWAPHRKQVELVLLDGGRRRGIAMQREEHGYFVHQEPNVAEGQRYAYRLDNGPERPDPASLWQPDGIHQPSAVLRPERFAWTNHAWQGVPREDLVFYELHAGTFTPEGTLDAVIPRLPALRELGVTAVELMPVAQFPGGRSWGYDGVHLYAVQNSYGGPHGLQRLVDACHVAGLAIFLDVVYNHLGPEGNYLHEFGPYFTDRYRTPWGPAFNYDGSDCDPVRDFIFDNVRLWIGEYRMDGLRLDATHAIIDASPTHILRGIKETADAAAGARGRRAHVVAEHLRNDVRILLPPERGGYGLDAEWNDDFHHAVHAYLTGERGGYYEDFGAARHLPKVLEETYVIDGVYSRFRGRRFGAPAGGLSGDRFVVSIQNHDQVGNRARGDRLRTLVHPPALRLAASLMLLAPHLPLLFMGEEYGEEHPFLYFCSFLNPRLAESVRQGRRRDYAAFMHGHVPDPQAESTFTASRLSWSWPEGSPGHLVRGPAAQEPAGAWTVYFNLTDQFQRLSEPAPAGMAWLFSSEAGRYHGSRPRGEPLERLWPWECTAFGPPLGEALL
jgi:maltooligosyltrehalose trehalohydrolase